MEKHTLTEFEKLEKEANINGFSKQQLISYFENNLSRQTASEIAAWLFLYYQEQELKEFQKFILDKFNQG